MRGRSSAALVLVLAAGAAWGEEELAPVPTAGQAWSVVGARTVGQNANVVEAAAGWPSLQVTYVRGLAPMLDVGVRGSFTYGVEGVVTQVMPGLKLQGLLRVRLLDTNRVSLGVFAEPGPLFLFERFGNTLGGFTVPVGLRLGIATSSALSLGVSFEVPLWVLFTSGGGFSRGVYVPILTGLGVEYFVRSDLCVFLRTKMGPTIQPSGFAAFTFDATFGLGWKF